jgi:hypothetical protein
LSLAAAGCGISVPPPGPAGSTVAAAPVPRPAPPPSAAVPANRSSPRPGRQPNPYVSNLAAAALIAFATQYINWDAHNVEADMRLLATESIGQAHSAMELTAGEVARDYELQRGGIANSGKVEGISPLDGSGGEWVVVTRERTTSTASTSYQGLAPAWHVIVAKAVRLWPGRWAISVWQPEN